MQRIAWLFIAALHTLPVLPLLRPAMLTTLYGVPATGAPALLLRHRAALFLAVAAVSVLAAFDPASRRAAGVLAAISMGSFLALYLLEGAPPTLKTIARADLIGAPVLLYLIWDAFVRAAP